MILNRLTYPGLLRGRWADPCAVRWLERLSACVFAQLSGCCSRWYEVCAFAVSDSESSRSMLLVLVFASLRSWRWGCLRDGRSLISAEGSSSVLMRCGRHQPVRTLFLSHPVYATFTRCYRSVSRAVLRLRSRSSNRRCGLW